MTLKECMTLKEIFPTTIFSVKLMHDCTVEHDFNGHEVNGIHGVYGKKCYCRAFHLVNKLHDFNGMHDLSGNFCYDDFFRKTHARLY